MNKRYYSYNRIHPLTHQYSLGDVLKQQWQAPNWDKVNLEGLANAAIGVAGNAINPNGNNNRVGNFISGAGDVVSMINPLWGAAVKGVGMLTNAAFGSNVNTEAVNGLQSDLISAKGNIGNSLTWDTLADNMRDLSGINVEGANLGSQGWFNNDVDRERNKLLRMQNSALSGVGYAVDNINTLQNRQAMGTLLANGGPIFKTDYDMGLTFVNNGGTHEQNPYGGVFMGMAPDGQPNQVEEGEVIFNDYVYSNRLKVPKAVRNKYKLREKKELSFAEAIEDYIKKNGIEERNNDPIANRGLEAFASELAMEQEMVKAKKEMRKSRQAAFGGHLFAGGGPYILYDRNYRDFDTLYNQESPYMQALNWFNSPENAAERDALIADINSGKYNNTTDNINGFTVTPDNWYRLATDYKKGPVHNALIAWANQTHADAEAKRALGTLPEISDSNTLNNGVVGIRALNKRGELDNTSAIWNYAANKGGLYNNATPKLAGQEERDAILAGTKTPKGTEEESTYDPSYWWRMAGLGANAAGLLYNIFDPYHPQTVNEARYTTVNPKYIGDYLIANPFDINYETSQQDANTAALRNALMQSVSPIRNASLLSADFNANATRGAARRQALEYNDAMKKAVTEFNRGTNQFNAQMYVDAATKNQAAKQAYFQDKLRQAQFNSQMDFYHKTAKDQAIGQGITSIADYLNDMGRENIQSGWVDALAKSGVFGSLNEPMTDILTRLMSSVGHTKNRKK